VQVVLPDAAVRQLERENIQAALRQCGGRIRGSGGAAELLGLKPTTLASRIKTLGIRKPTD
jgi:transcriptional regulator with GAF, ATPase, and Fis domain